MSQKVAKKILDVMKDVDVVEKTSKGGVSYKFQAWEDVLPAIRAAMLKHGLVIVPSMGPSEITEWEGKGSKMAAHNVPLKFTLIDSDSGESLEAEWSGESRDVSDKGKQKAATSGMKYWLLKLFMVPAEDDVAHDEQAPSLAKAAAAQVASPMVAFFREHQVPKDSPLAEALKARGEDKAGCDKIVSAYLSECHDCEDQPTPAGLADYIAGLKP